MTAENFILIPFGIVAGIAAIVTMDVLGSVAQRVGLIVGAKGQWVGRWYLGILRGQFFHSDIAAVPEIAGEKKAALVGHCVIGIVLAVFYLVSTDLLGISANGVLAAIGYGLATCIFPWFLVFPALGFGCFGLKGPRNLRLFVSSLMNHLFYGFGLWWIAQILPVD